MLDNGKQLLAEVKSDAEVTKEELLRRVTELEDSARHDQARLMQTREYPVMVREEAQQRITGMEETLTHPLLVEARDHVEMTKQDPQRRIAELGVPPVVPVSDLQLILVACPALWRWTLIKNQPVVTVGSVPLSPEIADACKLLEGHSEPQDDHAVIGGVPLGPESNPGDTSSVPDGSEDDMVNFLLMKSSEELMTGQQLSTFRIPAPSRMRAPKGGAGPRLVVTRSNSVSSQYPRAPSRQQLPMTNPRKAADRKLLEEDSHLEPQDDHAVIDGVPLGPESNPGDTFSVSDGSEDDVVNFLSMKSSEELMTGQQLSTFRIPAPSRMRAPKGGAGPRLVVTHSNSVSSQYLRKTDSEPPMNLELIHPLVHPPFAPIRPTSLRPQFPSSRARRGNQRTRETLSPLVARCTQFGTMVHA
ncbi:hypothetical protein APHAL10511_002803 [Amanita phalloides]|nr:hypothetical protein APHAL10511_002803 [Amanita phalloides]